jgi:hypothetical protein
MSTKRSVKEIPESVWIEDDCGFMNVFPAYAHMNFAEIMIGNDEDEDALADPKDAVPVPENLIDLELERAKRRRS